MAIVSVDPSKRKNRRSPAGDRIRMNAINHPSRFYALHGHPAKQPGPDRYVKESICILKAARFDLIVLETSGIDKAIPKLSRCRRDYSLYVMTPEYGAATQLEKIDMLDFADAIALNKFDKRGALTPCATCASTQTQPPTLGSRRRFFARAGNHCLQFKQTSA